KKHRPQSEASYLDIHVDDISLVVYSWGRWHIWRDFVHQITKKPRVKRPDEPRHCAENLSRGREHILANRPGSLPPVEVLHAASSRFQVENPFGPSKQHGEHAPFVAAR
ncbi:unnamed protein product, partial [Ectocarpus sp. 13 AM-2016]